MNKREMAFGLILCLLAFAGIPWSIGGALGAERAAKHRQFDADVARMVACGNNHCYERTAFIIGAQR